MDARNFDRGAKRHFRLPIPLIGFSGRCEDRAHKGETKHCARGRSQNAHRLLLLLILEVCASSFSSCRTPWLEALGWPGRTRIRRHAEVHPTAGTFANAWGTSKTPGGAATA